MTDLEILHQAILNDPADDLPRLAYADALEERGDGGDDARAEFIRVQIEYARLQSDECACGFVPFPVCDVCRFQKRERDLWYDVFGGNLPEELVGGTRTHVVHFGESGGYGHGVVRRGFTDEFQCSTAY